MENAIHYLEIAALSKVASGVVGKGGQKLYSGGLTPGVDLGHRWVGVFEALRACRTKLMNDRQIQELENRIMMQQKSIKNRIMHQMR